MKPSNTEPGDTVRTWLQVVRSTELRPRDARAAPLTIGHTAFPGVVARAGVLLDASCPIYGPTCSGRYRADPWAHVDPVPGGAGLYRRSPSCSRAGYCDGRDRDGGEQQSDQLRAGDTCGAGRVHVDHIAEARTGEGHEASCAPCLASHSQVARSRVGIQGAPTGAGPVSAGLPKPKNVRGATG
ncbi:hypothetical protein H7X46_14045 [Pseudonocardia sp. C8]|uniref:DUF6226 family protein n=1 Tax=Pseudonocardia sp. C8 TaxID=2762759 RepID=UPI001642D737|nr:DUF6226 family protein [Pseudonocardia sp. C8]MBC3192184.1 hypothetical protein [Pseudonocardia sp. C8]